MFINSSKRYTEEFKIEAVKQVTERGYSVADVTDNILDRDFGPAQPNKSWVSDITYVRTYKGFLYVATVLDLFSRRIIGWSMDKNIDRHLVINALLMAVWTRQPTQSVW